MATLRIDNFKCYKKSSVHLNDMTVLVGANGSGKSSIIQALLLLRKSIREKNHSLLSVTDFFKQNLGSYEDIVYLNDPTQFINISWADESTASKCSVRLAQPVNETLFAAEVIKSKRSHCQLTKDEFHYIAADRQGSSIVQPMRYSDYSTVGEHGQFTAQILADKFKKKIIPERMLNGAENNSPFLLDQANLYLNEIFPGVKVDAVSNETMQSAQIVVKNSFYSRFGLSTNIGIGISYVLPIIVSGLIAAPGSMMIVENPEAHLHPKAQSLIGKFLSMVADTGTRVIVETHSDHLINGIQIYAVTHPEFIPRVTINNVRIKGQQAKIDCINLSENGDYSDWPEGFMDQNRKDLYELMIARNSL